MARGWQWRLGCVFLFVVIPLAIVYVVMLGQIGRAIPWLAIINVLLFVLLLPISFISRGNGSLRRDPLFSGMSALVNLGFLGTFILTGIQVTWLAALLGPGSGYLLSTLIGSLAVTLLQATVERTL